MPLGDRGFLAGVVEPLARVEPDRREQVVAPLATTVGGDEPRRAGEHVSAARDVDAVTGADGLDRGGLEAAAKTASLRKGIRSSGSSRSWLH